MTLVDFRLRPGPAHRPRPKPLRVLVADSQPVVRDGLRALFGSVEGMSLVAEVAGIADVLREVHLHRPDVLVLDLELPGGDGISGCRQVLRSAPETRVLIFNRFADAASVTAAMRAGARGYLLKRAGGADVLRAVRSVAAGEVIFGAEVANAVTDLFFTSDSRVRAPFPELTARERQVLELVAAGLPNSAIARQLDLATKTVGNHVSSVLGKLRVPDRAAAIIRAREAGLERPVS